MKRLTLKLCCTLAAASLALSSKAQFAIADVGTTAPTPGPNDVYCIIPSIQDNDGLNYYWDNGNPVGQTFVTGSNSTGYTLMSLALMTAGNGGSWGSGAAASVLASQNFTLTIYSIDESGNATPVATNSTVGALITQGDWMQWSGLGVPLLPNMNYAYTFKDGDTDSGGNWEQLANNGNNPYTNGQICSIPVGGGAVEFGNSGISDAVFDIGLALGTAPGGTVTIADIGANAPTPGANDISQLLPTVVPMQNNYGLNYYWDSGAGETFQTPSSTVPWLLTNLVIGTGGNGGGGQTAAQAFVLRIYSVTNNGATAILIYSNSYNTSLNADLDWMQCSGMNLRLNPNQQYAYTFYRGNSGSWEQMADYDHHPYSGGMICLIPPAGGTIEYGSQSGNSSSDAAFDVGLAAESVYAQIPTYTPEVNPIYAGTPVTLSEAPVGTGTMSFQWQTDGGSGGTLTNIPGASSSNLLVNTAGLAAGTFNYDVVVKTMAGGGISSTSAVAPLTIIAASAPFLVTDTTASPNAASNYVGLSQIYSASFSGTLPFGYQWYVASNVSGSGSTPVAGGTNATLVLNNLQLANSGYYSLQATNNVYPYSLNSSWTQLTVFPAADMLVHWQAPVVFNGLTAGQILTNNIPGTFFEGAYFGTATEPIPVVLNGVTNTFYGDGSTISISGQDGENQGTWLTGGITTGDTNLDTILNQFAYNISTGTQLMSIHNLLLGTNYYVQIFALDDRLAGAGQFTSFQNPTDNADVSAAWAMSANNYVVGTFTAPNTDVDIQQNLFPVGSLNAVIVGTAIQSLVNTNPLTVNFKATLSGQALKFTWSADHQGWQLYTNAVGVAATNSWYPVSGSANGTSQTITLDPTKSNVFFELRYP